MEYQEVVKRISAARVRAGLSARELSGQIGKNANYISKLECVGFQISVGTLLSILEACQMSPQEFFYPDFTCYQEDQSLLKFLRSMTDEQKKVVASLASFWQQRK